MRKSRVSGRCPHCLQEIGVPLAPAPPEPLKCVKCPRTAKNIYNTRKSYERRGGMCVKCWNHSLTPLGRIRREPKSRRTCRLCGAGWNCYPSYIKRREKSALLTSALCVQCRRTFRRANCTVIRDLAPLYLVRLLNGRKFIAIYEDVKRKRSEFIPLARFLVECFIGRRLNGKAESVHHKNHDKTDDRIENLSVVENRAHMRQHTAEQKINPTWKNYIFREFPCAYCGKVARRRGTRARFCSKSCLFKARYYRKKLERDGNGKAEVPGVRNEVQAPGGLGGLLLEPLRPTGEAEEMA